MSLVTDDWVLASADFSGTPGLGLCFVFCWFPIEERVRRDDDEDDLARVFSERKKSGDTCVSVTSPICLRLGQRGPGFS